MKIGIDAQRLHGPPNGPQTYRRRLSEAILHQESQIELVCFQFSDTHHELFEHPRVHKVVVRGVPGLVERRLDSLDVDVLHLGAGLHRYPFLSHIQTPTIATIHGIEPLVLDDTDEPLRVKIQKGHVWPRIARHLDRIIVVSESARCQLLEHYPVNPNCVTPIYNGLDHDQYSPRDEMAVSAVLDNFNVERPYYVSVSGYTERKNPETLVGAFDEAAAQLPDYSFLIVGPGWDNPTVSRLIRDANNDDSIHRLGKVPYDALPALYTGAEALVSPTKHENFGLTLVESLACGTPVVASNVYAVPEAVDGAGILIDDPDDVTGFSDGMVRLAEDQLLREEYGRLALEQASQFTWERCAQDVLNVYEMVV